jgi:hypothetical protein
MRTGTARILVAVVVLLALHGCGAEQEPADGPSATPAATPTPVDILRIGDDGASVTLEVGGTAIVFLPASHDWEEPVVDGAAVTISADVSDEGSTSRSWTVTGQQAGAATLTLTGSPTCRSETPSCATPDVVWSADFTVR